MNGCFQKHSASKVLEGTFRCQTSNLAVSIFSNYDTDTKYIQKPNYKFRREIFEYVHPIMYRRLSSKGNGSAIPPSQWNFWALL